MPTAVGLVLAGLVLGALAKIENLSWLAEFELRPGVILFVFLPTLLFESAFNIDARRLGENLLPVFILAVSVLLLSVVIVGLIVGVGVGIPIGIALIFGALISATDPVAVLSIFREVGAPKRLALLVDRESLFNDGAGYLMAQLVERIDALKIAESYESDRGEMDAIAEVLQELEAMAETGAAGEAMLAKARELYGGRLAAVGERVRLTGERPPEFVNFARRQASRRHLLVTREQSHRHLYEIGVLSEKVFRQLEDEVVDELISLRQIPVGAMAWPDVAEFMRVMPLFADLTAEELEPLVS